MTALRSRSLCVASPRCWYDRLAAGVLHCLTDLQLSDLQLNQDSFADAGRRLMNKHPNIRQSQPSQNNAKQRVHLVQIMY